MRALLVALLIARSETASADPIAHWAPFISEAAKRFRVPEQWIRRVMKQESGGQSRIVSPKGAMGLMQLMPGTWRDMKALVGLGNDPFDPRDNILAGAAYLRILHERFGNPGMFAAYNAGPARYAHYLSGEQLLPRETLAYVVAIARGRVTITPARRQSSLFADASAHKLEPSAPASLFAEIRAPDGR